MIQKYDGLKHGYIVKYRYGLIKLGKTFSWLDKIHDFSII